MKFLHTILVVAFVFTAATAFASGKHADETITVGSTKHRTFFVFKAQKKFVGATVEIYASNGDLLTTQNLERRKMVIDFGSVTTDTYTIRIIKGDARREYQYIKH
jgi:flagellar hook assembly protein FlgD